MADSKTTRNGPDRDRINVHQDYELRDWAKTLEVTPDQLKEAVEAVGDRVDRVQVHLNGLKAFRSAGRQPKSDTHTDIR